MPLVAAAVLCTGSWKKVPFVDFCMIYLQKIGPFIVFMATSAPVLLVCGDLVGGGGGGQRGSLLCCSHTRVCRE